MTDALDREAVERARFLDRTTNLDRDHARAVALAELGYTDRAIARALDVASGTPTAWLDDVADCYGAEAVHPTPADDRGMLTPVHGDDPQPVAPTDGTCRVLIEAEVDPAGADLERYHRTWTDDGTVHRQQKVAVRLAEFDERTADRLAALGWDEHHVTWTDNYEFTVTRRDDAGAWTADATLDTADALREAGVPVPPLDDLALVARTWPWRPADGRTCPVCDADRVASADDLDAFPTVGRLEAARVVDASPVASHLCLGCRRILVLDDDHAADDHDLADDPAEVTG